MIWALLEITLPLCLTFLFGLCAGWLLWRWRRTIISSQEWDSQSGESDIQLLTAQHEEVKTERDTMAASVTSLEQKIETQKIEISALEKTADKLSEELESKDQNGIDALDFATQTASTLPLQMNTDDKAEDTQLITDLQNKLKAAETSTREAEEKVHAAELRDTQLTQQNDDLQQKLKQAESATEERDSAIDKVQQLEAQLLESDTTQAKVDELEVRLQQTQSELETIQSKASADAADNARNKDLLAEQATQLETAQQTADELSKTKSAVVSARENNNKLRIKLERLESDLATANTEVSTSASDNADLKRKLAEQESLLQQADITASELAKSKSALSSGEELTGDLRNKVIRLEAELKSARDVAAANEQDKQKIQELTEEVQKGSRLTAELARANATVANREAANGNLRTTVSQLEAELVNARRNSSDADATRSKVQVLQQQLQQANAGATELSRAKANIERLNEQLKAAQTQSQKFSAKPESRLELRDLQTKFAEVTAQLNREKSRSESLESRLKHSSEDSKAPVTSISVGQVARLKSEIENRDDQIAALNKKLKNKATKNKALKNKKKNAWQKGETKLGTPGCDHKDDLSKISGIGPKIEKVLNRLGIKSWEQLAALKAADVKKVDEALTDFSGRIQRDEWVKQAKMIMRNGHQPLDVKPNPKKPAKTKSSTTPKAAKKPKKTAKAKPKKHAWQKGKTRFGTPGSLHRDDLKVINGIGPVIEQALNRRGIRSWEQLAILKASDIKVIDEKLDFPGRIKREQWVQQAKALIKQFPKQKERPTRREFLNQVAS